MELVINHTFNDADEVVSFLDALSSQIQAGFTSGILGEVSWSLVKE